MKGRAEIGDISDAVAMVVAAPAQRSANGESNGGTDGKGSSIPRRAWRAVGVMDVRHRSAGLALRMSAPRPSGVFARRLPRARSCMASSCRGRGVPPSPLASLRAAPPCGVAPLRRRTGPGVRRAGEPGRSSRSLHAKARFVIMITRAAAKTARLRNANQRNSHEPRRVVPRQQAPSGPCTPGLWQRDREQDGTCRFGLRRDRRPPWRRADGECVAADEYRHHGTAPHRPCGSHARSPHAPPASPCGRWHRRRAATLVRDRRGAARPARTGMDQQPTRRAGPDGS